MTFTEAMDHVAKGFEVLGAAVPRCAVSRRPRTTPVVAEPSCRSATRARTLYRIRDDRRPRPRWSRPRRRPSRSVAVSVSPRMRLAAPIVGAVLANSSTVASRCGGICRGRPSGRRMSCWWIVRR